MFSHVLIESLQGKKNDTVVSFENFKYGNAKLLSIRFNSSGSEMTEKMEKKITRMTRKLTTAEKVRLAKNRKVIEEE